MANVTDSTENTNNFAHNMHSEEIMRTIKKFFTDECPYDIIEHLNLVCADAIALTDGENEPFHNHDATVKIVATNAKIVNLLAKIGHHSRFVKVKK